MYNSKSTFFLDIKIVLFNFKIETEKNFEK